MDNKIELRKENKLKALKKGNFLNDFGIDVDCYVLDDEEKTAVISQVGMAKSLGLNENSSAMPRFVSGKVVSEYVNAGLRQKLENPLIFRGLSTTPGIPPPTVHGYDVTILIDICKAVLTARSNGKLTESRYDNIVEQAQIITSASAKAGIKGLVYAITGYDATREEIINNFRRYVTREAQEYEREFPNQLYAEWCRLYKVKMPKRNKPWICMHLTRTHVYAPLGNSNGEILKLLKEFKNSDKKNRNKKLFQFLEVIGKVALRQHLGQLLGIARISKTSREYEKHFDTLFGKDVQIILHDLPIDEIDEIDERILTDFDKSLKLVVKYK